MLCRGSGLLCVVMVLVGPVCSLDPWNGWVPPDLHGWWGFDSLDMF